MTSSQHILARLTADPGIKLAIKTAKAAIAEHQLAVLERSDELDPASAADRLKRTISTDMRKAELESTLARINLLTSPAAKQMARVLKEQFASHFSEKCAGHIEQLLKTALAKLAQYRVEAEAAENAFFAQHSAPVERTSISRRYAGATAELSSMLSDWIAHRTNPLIAARNAACRVPAPLQWFGVEIIA